MTLTVLGADQIVESGASASDAPGLETPPGNAGRIPARSDRDKAKTNNFLFDLIIFRETANNFRRFRPPYF